MQKAKFIHPTAEVNAAVDIGEGTYIWNWVQVREDVSIGSDVILSKGVYIDAGVKIGSKVKVQNNVSIYHGVSIEDGVFIGPHVCFTNDIYPRAISADGKLKGGDDWQTTETRVEYGASIGANSTVLAGVTIGRFALVAAGSVVTISVAPYTVVRGNPARFAGYVCACGRLISVPEKGEVRCKACGAVLEGIKPRKAK